MISWSFCPLPSNLAVTTGIQDVTASGQCIVWHVTSRDKILVDWTLLCRLNNQDKLYIRRRGETFEIFRCSSSLLFRLTLLSFSLLAAERSCGIVCSTSWTHQWLSVCCTTWPRQQRTVWLCVPARVCPAISPRSVPFILSCVSVRSCTRVFISVQDCTFDFSPKPSFSSFGVAVSAAVFQLQRAADPAGLLRVPPHQQHREAGSNGAHPAHVPPAGGVAPGGPIWQRRPAGHCQHPVSDLPETHTRAHSSVYTLSQFFAWIVQLLFHNTAVQIGYGPLFNDKVYIIKDLLSRVKSYFLNMVSFFLLRQLSPVNDSLQQ